MTIPFQNCDVMYVRGIGMYIEINHSGRFPVAVTNSEAVHYNVHCNATKNKTYNYNLCHSFVRINVNLVNQLFFFPSETVLFAG